MVVGGLVDSGTSSLTVVGGEVVVVTEVVTGAVEVGTDSTTVVTSVNNSSTFLGGNVVCSGFFGSVVSSFEGSIVVLLGCIPSSSTVPSCAT